MGRPRPPSRGATVAEVDEPVGPASGRKKPRAARSLSKAIANAAAEGPAAAVAGPSASPSVRRVRRPRPVEPVVTSTQPQRAAPSRGRRRRTSSASLTSEDSDGSMSDLKDTDSEEEQERAPRGAGRRTPRAPAKKTEAMSQYEEERLRTIRENQAFLLTLGLQETKAELSALGETPGRSPGSRHYVRRTPPSSGPVRKSRRLGGLEAECESLEEEDDDGDEGRAGAEEEGEAKPAAERGFYTKCLWMGRKQTTNFVLTDRLPKRIALPLTLCSIGTTVWELGSIHTGPKKDLYWSNHQCLFKHPYPVGYRASKEHFGRLYHMHILEGPHGPIFRVQQENGPTWTGPTPTQPWTGACLASKSPGTRVSGPLFFGFSDPIVQRLIECMPNYEPPVRKTSAAAAAPEADTAE